MFYRNILLKIDFFYKQFAHSALNAVLQFRWTFRRQDDFFSKVVVYVVAKDAAMFKITWSAVQKRELIYTDEVRCSYGRGVTIAVCIFEIWTLNKKNPGFNDP